MRGKMCEATDKRKDPPVSGREGALLMTNGAIGQRASCGAGRQETKEMDTLQGGIGCSAVRPFFFPFSFSLLYHLEDEVGYVWHLILSCNGEKNPLHSLIRSRGQFRLPSLFLFFFFFLVVMLIPFLCVFLPFLLFLLQFFKLKHPES